MNVSMLTNQLFQAAAEVDQKYQVSIINRPKSYFENFPAMLENLMNIVLTIGVVAVLLYLIWGGLEWITSGGDKGKTEGARNKITAAIVGLIILVSAWAIMTFVQSLLNISILK
ncbi:hypothetical protein KA012_00060 [Candidatus Woesebacteria bacterium]|nr:hypothetical protein [Candidatus Woesebacteria bacterium]